MSSGVHTERSYELVARQLEQQILAKQIEPGDALPTESAMAVSLGVNRSTVREALRTLEQNGLIAREAGRKKLRVRIPQPADVTRRVTSVMLSQQVTFRELYEAMRAVEPACAAAAAERANADHIAQLEDNLAATEAAIAQGESLVALDIAFHQLVAIAAQSRALEMMREPLGQLFYPAFEEVMLRLNVSDRLLAAHRNIVAAIQARHIKEARDWMQRHIDDFRRGYELAHIEMDRPIC
ncbi:FadR/GntR family transcriptional regulator [Sphingobium tyrosinilyticum]|uniref:FadR/GntR family transcriptional regulator n=1 Tax=Sphingobium tyrosinilyticum TaxID=2715436 RepID=A0ABV9F1D6_9SPHN